MTAVEAADEMLGEQQRDLADAVRSLLAKRSGSAEVRAACETDLGYDEALWSTLCEQIGVAGLAIPEEYGGAGAGPVEMHVVLEELGRTLTPSPLLGSVVLAANAVLYSGDRQACERILPGIAEGRSVAALAWCGPRGRWDPERPACVATGDERRPVLNGRACYVLDGAHADVLVVAASTGSDVGIFEVDPGAGGVHRREETPMDPTRRLATVDLADVPATPLTSSGGAEVLRRVRDLGCVALSAEQVGATAEALQRTVEHAQQRRQFGRPIGAFQALKHRMAEAFVSSEAARSASYAAAFAAERAERAERDEPELDRRAAVAKVWCSEAFQQVTAEMVQLHGGVAITWEHDAHLFFKRAHGSAQLLGQPAEHVERLSAREGFV